MEFWNQVLLKTNDVGFEPTESAILTKDFS